MFVCDDCHEKQFGAGPAWHSQSLGMCEICGQLTITNDCHCRNPLPASPEPIIRCDNCHRKLTKIYSSEQVQIVRQNGGWVKEVVSDEIKYHCPHCHEELDPDDLGIPNHIR